MIPDDQEQKPEPEPSGSRRPPRPPIRIAAGLDSGGDEPREPKRPKKETVRINLPPKPSGLKRRAEARRVNSTCPKCHGTNIATLSPGHPLVWHWLINPALAANELLLGQRLPRVSQCCRDCRLPLVDRSWVVCPHCGGTHSARLWQGVMGFGHWFGVVCPNCGQVIPSLWNFTSRVLLLLTLPIWYFPARWFRRRYLRYEFDRVRKRKRELQPFDRGAGQAAIQSE